MIQQVIPFTLLFRSLDRLSRFGISVLLFLTSMSGLYATPLATGQPGDTLITATICANESYAFNGDTLFTSGTYSATFTASDGTDSVVVLELSVLPLASSQVEASICQGATYAFNGQNLTQAGQYEATLVAENGCDSMVTLTLAVLPNPLTNLSAGICTGSSYIFQGDTLTESGSYSAVLPAENGCDSIVRLKLDVVPFFEVNYEATICQGDSLLFGGDTLFTDGVYTDTLTAAGGCDSIITLTLKTLPVSNTAISAIICNGSEYIFHGDTLTASGIYTDTLQAANGCDSLVTLKLETVNFFESNLTAVICDGEKFIFGNDTLGASGIYTDSLTAGGGCDSLVILTLTVLPASGSASEAVICAGDTMTFNGQALTEAGEYHFILEGSNGCDSIVTLQLTVLPVSATALEATVCKGESYPFQGEELTAPGTYQAVFEAANGCDSTVTLTLHVLPLGQTDIQASICAGAIYEYNGDTLTQAGSYPYIFQGENGCDSTVTIILTVNEPQTTDLHVTLCAGDSYVFNGETLTEAGTFTALLTGANGCDSTVTLSIELLPVWQTALETSICSGESYAFNGDTLTESGVYTAILSTGNGCDSTVTLTLTVLPTQNTLLEAEICAGASYSYNGTSITESGTYLFVLEGSNGCDSTVTLNLTVLPVQATALNASICAGSNYDYNGETLTESGDYTFTFTGENGCDSVVTLSLEVLPVSESGFSVTLCEGASYVFDGDTLTTGGAYQKTYTGLNGCDSTVTLQLTFVPFFETSLSATICAGESYVFGNDTLNESGDYIQTLTAGGGCDSILNLALTVLLPVGSSVEASICAGESFEFNGEILTESGTYSAQLTGVNGCDSVAILNLTVLPAQISTLSATICANETYAFNGESLDESGLYSATLTGANGCDSTVLLTLTVEPLLSSEIEATVCNGESYDYDGTALTESGTYTFVQEAANGCDSIVTVKLSVLPLAESAFASVNCNGESFEYNGTVLTESGIYEFVFPGQSANGCDSVVTVYLTIFPVIPSTETSATICAGETYDFYGSPVSAAGTYSIDLASANGCDSTIILVLNVLPDAATSIEAVVCKGEGYEFNGETIFAPGAYTAHLTTVNGCDSVVTLQLSVYTVNSAVELQGGTLTAQAGNGTVQWFDCDANQPVPGATGNTFTPAQTGNYAAIVTQNGCTDTSECFLVQVVAASEPFAASNWKLQPNPARTASTVVLENGMDEAFDIEIFDLTGRLLYRQHAEKGETRFVLDLAGMPDGMLQIRLVNAQGASVKSLVKATN